MTVFVMCTLIMCLLCRRMSTHELQDLLQLVHDFSGVDGHDSISTSIRQQIVDLQFRRIELCEAMGSQLGYKLYPGKVGKGCPLSSSAPYRLDRTLGGRGTMPLCCIPVPLRQPDGSQYTRELTENQFYFGRVKTLPGWKGFIKMLDARHHLAELSEWKYVQQTAAIYHYIQEDHKHATVVKQLMYSCMNDRRQWKANLARKIVTLRDAQTDDEKKQTEVKIGDYTSGLMEQLQEQAPGNSAQGNNTEHTTTGR